MKPTVDVKTVIDQSHVNPFHIKLLITFIIITMFDGYDMFYLGNIIPSLIQDWGITTTTAGILMSSGLVGMALGAVILGMVADRMGRRFTVSFAIFTFSIFTFIASFAVEPIFFAICRFLAGLGLGGVIPVLNASLGEFLPKKRRIAIVTLVNIGAPIGGMLTSLTAIYIVPHFGWRPVLWIGSLPLFLIPFVLKVLPNSPEYNFRNRQFEKLSDVLNKITGKNIYNANDFKYTFTSQNVKNQSSVKSLFTDKRAVSTLLFWVAVFMNLVALYGLSTWIPSIMVQAGYSLTLGISFLLILKLGAIVGAVIGGGFTNRFNAKFVIVVYFIVGFIALIILGLKPPFIISYILLFISGAATNGTQMLMNSYIAQFYPTHIKATGTGWSIGIGRIGGIVSPIIGSLILSSIAMPYIVNFLLFAIPCFIAAISFFYVQEKYSVFRA